MKFADYVDDVGIKTNLSLSGIGRNNSLLFLQELDDYFDAFERPANKNRGIENDILVQANLGNYDSMENIIRIVAEFGRNARIARDRSSAYSIINVARTIGAVLQSGGRDEYIQRYRAAECTRSGQPLSPQIIQQELLTFVSDYFKQCITLENLDTLKYVWGFFENDDLTDNSDPIVNATVLSLNITPAEKDHFISMLETKYIDFNGRPEYRAYIDDQLHTTLDINFSHLSKFARSVDFGRMLDNFAEENNIINPGLFL